MSYILDALRKSEQQRQHGMTPRLSSAQIVAPTNTSTPEKTAWLPIVLLSIALISAGVTIGWLRPWQQDDAVPAQEITAKPTTISPAPATPPRQEAITAPQPELAALTTSTTLAAIPTPIRPEMPATVVETKPLPPASVTTQTATTTTIRQASPVNKPKPHTASQPELPNITITVHAYSTNPAERIAGINRRLLREGDEVAPGLKLEQITENAVILNFNGHRFRRGLH